MEKIEIAKIILEKLLDGEIGNYGFFEGWKVGEPFGEEDSTFHFEIDTVCRTLQFRITVGEDKHSNKIEVELGEDNWQEIDWFESSIKYFWMALLYWDDEGKI